MFCLFFFHDGGGYSSIPISLLNTCLLLYSKHIKLILLQLHYILIGCQNFTSMDGIWKLRFPHCMWPVKSEVCGVPNVNYPNVCTEEPSSPQSALCVQHRDLARAKGIPTALREFIHDFCGVPRRGTGNSILIIFIFINIAILVYEI